MISGLRICNSCFEDSKFWLSQNFCEELTSESKKLSKQMPKTQLRLDMPAFRISLIQNLFGKMFRILFFSDQVKNNSLKISQEWLNWRLSYGFLVIIKVWTKNNMSNESKFQQNPKNLWLSGKDLNWSECDVHTMNY